MPNFYTHLRFAGDVAQLLPPHLNEKIKPEWDSYCCGNFGPDPLYFGGNRAVGLALHHGSGRAALERYRTAVQKELPYSVSFASGYLLHFLLDSSLHPLVYEAMEKTGCTHRQVEGELDRLLLDMDGQLPREAMPVKSMPRSFYYMAGKMAPEVTAEAYALGLKRFRMISMKLWDWTGTPIRHVTNLASHLPKIHGLYGAVLDTKPQKQLEGYLREMVEVYDKTVEYAPAFLTDCMEAMHRDTPFPKIMKHNFSGKQVE